MFIDSCWVSRVWWLKASVAWLQYQLCDSVTVSLCKAGHISRLAFVSSSVKRELNRTISETVKMIFVGLNLWEVLWLSSSVYYIKLSSYFKLFCNLPFLFIKWRKRKPHKFLKKYLKCLSIFIRKCLISRSSFYYFNCSSHIQLMNLLLIIPWPIVLGTVIGINDHPTFVVIGGVISLFLSIPKFFACLLTE
jgi:hypothetical protein